jgi:hypothetical protein
LPLVGPRYDRKAAYDPDAQQFARRRLRPLDQPYRGCEHGCIYCFARPTHAYHDLSPGIDFESRLFAKPDAAKLLHAALSRPGYEAAPIALGTNTDPYQPIEERFRITRSILELLLETRHPFTITTKSDRVLRDLDIIVSAARLGLASVAISVTSLDPASTARSNRARRPRASVSQRCKRSPKPGSRPMSQSRPSSRTSPITSLKRSSNRPRRPAPRRLLHSRSPAA